MTSNYTLTSDQIKDAVEAIKMNKPVYADMLDFYGKIFDAQEMNKGRIQIQPLQISEEMCTVKAREKLPPSKSMNLFLIKLKPADFFPAFAIL